MQKEESQKRKGGRPKKDPATLRDRVFSVRFSEIELLEVMERAGACSQDPAVYVRNAALGRELRPVPVVNREAWSTLGKFCGRISQVVASKKRGDPIFDFIGLDEFREMKALVVKLREALLK